MLDVICVCEQKEIFPAPLNMVSNNLILYAMHWNKHVYFDSRKIGTVKDLLSQPSRRILLNGYKLSDKIISLSLVAPSQVRTTAMLLLPLTKNWKFRHSGSIQSHTVRTKFCKESVKWLKNRKKGHKIHGDVVSLYSIPKKENTLKTRKS